MKENKIISVEIDDEITTAYDRIKRVRGEKVFLMVPRRATILQSIVNLKILKRKLDALEKHAVIVTNDENGLRLAEKAGFEVHEKITTKPQEEKTPHASRHTQRPTRIAGRRLSISDLLRRDQANVVFNFFRTIQERVRQRKKKEQYAPKIVIAAPNKQALFTLVLVSVVVLLAIAYIALPGATIYLKPAANPIEQPVNITLLDFDKNRLDLQSHDPQKIASYALRPQPFTKTISIGSTGKIFQGENARGKITIINERNRLWPLVSETRFQTENGIIFRIKSAVTVPAKIGDHNGELATDVVADPYDAQGLPVGERGNIAPTRFFLPGLQNEENRNMLYAVSKERMTGGITKTAKIVIEADIAAAEERLKKELRAEISDRLKIYLAEQNALNKTNLTLLDDSRAITVSKPETHADTNLAGKELASFEITGSIAVTGISFNRSELINVLKTELATKKSPEKRIAEMDEDNISYRIFDIDEKRGVVRLTAIIRGIEEYEIDPEEENGERLAKKIKDHVLGKRIEDAISYIQNLPEIESVKIKSWPLWAPSIPTVADNVEIVMAEE